MFESKDTAIKLFGKTIPLPILNHQIVSPNHSSSLTLDHATAAVTADHTSPSAIFLPQDTTGGSSTDGNGGDQKKKFQENSGEQVIEDKQEGNTSDHSAEDLKEPATTSSGISENPKTSSADRETSSLKSANNGEQSDTSSSQEKTLKKPDKILPCPRCNSMDTKFCYYNNYNVNQPRHFCKNCQRYWTAGGTMRNVPVGAGRRKNKSSSASHYRHIMVSEALRAAQVSASNAIHKASLGNTGTILNFGSTDSPLCESVASVLKLSEKPQNCAQNGFHLSEQRILISSGATADTADDHSTMNSSEKGHEAAAAKNYQAYPPQMPCFPGPPWPYPWNSSIPPPPAFCPSGFPVSFYPPPTYWSCAVPPPWSVPFITSPPSSLNQSPQSSGPSSPTLGKHSRDGNILSTPSNTEKEQPSTDTEKTVLVPKTLRIDDPREAAKSSIWATLGIKAENKSSSNGGGLFKGFQSRADDRNCMAEASPVLQANPAALSRSLNFHESI